MSSLGTPKKRYRSPSYYRRQARRKATATHEFVDVKTFAQCHKGISDAMITDNTQEVDNCGSSSTVEVHLSEDLEEASHVKIDETTDQDELDCDKVDTKISVHAVTKPLEKTSVVEEEIRKRFSDMNVRVERLQSFSDHHGNFESSRVTTSPVNLKHIRGRRLRLKNCEIQFFEPPPSSSYNSIYESISV